MSRLKFSLYVFGPISLGYILPLIFYELPLKFRTTDGVFTIEPSNLVFAVTASLVWFGLAVGCISIAPNFSLTATQARPWNKEATWFGFFFFSIIGSILAVFHRFFSLPGGIEQIVHQLSLMPTMGFILGVYCLQLVNDQPHWCLRKTIIFSILAVDLVICFILPIIFGIVGPAISSAIGILFGLGMLRIRPIGQIITFGLFGLILLIGLGVKKEIRALMCAGVCEQMPIQTVLAKRQPSNESEKIMPLSSAPETTKPPSPIKSHRFVKALSPSVEETKSQKESSGHSVLPSLPEIQDNFSAQARAFLGGYDPNSDGIRFLSAPLDNQSLQYIIARILHRLNRLGELSYVIQTTDEQIPFIGGETYLPILTKIIPRALWPDKPQETFGQYFGHRYRIIADHDLETSVNLPIIVEGYINWGWLGVLFSASLMGLLMRVLWEDWIGKHAAVGNVVLGTIVVMNTPFQGSNLSLVLGGILYGGIVYWVMELVIRLSFRNWKMPIYKKNGPFVQSAQS